MQPNTEKSVASADFRSLVTMPTKHHARGLTVPNLRRHCVDLDGMQNRIYVYFHLYIICKYNRIVQVGDVRLNAQYFEIKEKVVHGYWIGG